MIEVNRMFGVDRFVFYNFSIGGGITKYLHYYIEQGIVILLPWNLRSQENYGVNVSTVNSPYYAKKTAQTDCFYRNMDVSRYISFTDIDQIMAVRTADSLPLTAILQNVTDNVNAKICDYQFLHAFFMKDKNISNYDPHISKWEPASSSHTYRGDFWPAHKRSKYIADTRYLTMPSVHGPWQCHQGSIEVIIPSHLAALHHYRSFRKPHGYLDMTMWRYKDDILGRLEDIHKIFGTWYRGKSLRRRHNGCDIVSNHQPHHCLLNRLFRRRSKKTSKLRVTGLCTKNSPGTGEFSVQMASNAENVSIWWRHLGCMSTYTQQTRIVINTQLLRQNDVLT